jgi:hypothetical protein
VFKSSSGDAGGFSFLLRLQKRMWVATGVAGTPVEFLMQVRRTDRLA